MCKVDLYIVFSISLLSIKRPSLFLIQHIHLVVCVFVICKYKINNTDDVKRENTKNVTDILNTDNQTTERVTFLWSTLCNL